MSSSVPIEIASTIQSASINQLPDIRHDLNPSTSASTKEPVTISRPTHLPDEDEYSIDDDSEHDIVLEGDEEEDIPYSVIQPIPRKPHMPPLPDLRFEQSYLASIANADTNWKVAWITTRDQILLPLIQGTLWSLVQLGWRHWNLRANLSGNTLGSRFRRWWYKTNNWTLPPFTEAKNRFNRMTKDKGLAQDMGEVSRFLYRSLVINRVWFAREFSREYVSVWSFWG